MLTKKKKGMILPSIIVIIYLVMLVSLNYDFYRSFTLDFNFTLIEEISSKDKIDRMNISKILYLKYKNYDTLCKSMKINDTLKINDIAYIQLMGFCMYNNTMYGIFKEFIKVNGKSTVTGIIIDLTGEFKGYYCDIDG